MEKRTLLAIALSIMVMLLYARFMNTHYPQEVERPSPPEAAPTVDQTAPTVVAGGGQGVGEPYHFDERTVSLSDEVVENKEVIETEPYHIVLTNIGGAIQAIDLLEFPEEHSREPITLVRAETPEEGILGLDFGSTLSSPLSRTPFRTSGVLQVGDGSKKIIYTHTDPTGITIEKTYTFPNSNHHIELDVKITNGSPVAWQGQYQIIGGSRIDRSTRMDSRFLEASCLVNGKPQKLNKGTLRKTGSQKIPGEALSSLLRNRYFSALLFSRKPAIAGIGRGLPDNEASVGLEMPSETLMPGQSFMHSFLLYAGPTDLAVIADYNLGMDKAISMGVFGGIGRLFFAALKFFHSKVHNYGIAILLLGVLVSIILYPFTLRMHRSMKHMQEIQPKVEQLRRELKDNPQRLNKEIMELYKKNKVNPFGGCWPMLFQMPILFSLYPMLLRSVELKNAPFLWIKDLSEPDKAFALPFVIPKLGTHLNILPILTVVVMFLQQKLTMPKSQASGDDQIKQQQKLMSVFMPFMIGVIFYNMPSGFVLYWFTYMSISVFHQMRIRRA